MKKIIISFLIVIAIITTSLIFKNVIISDSYADNKRFKTIYRADDYYVVYDTKTKVEYSVSNAYYSRGIVTLLVNNNGDPLLYDGE